MTHGSLFSGIGGFDLAAEWMGWENIFHCEINQFGRQVLNHYWPKATSYEDITKTDFTIHRGRIDILSGGFPCFQKGTPILTKMGLIPIEEINIGDIVLTKDGNWKPVNAVMNKDNAPTIGIKFQGDFEPLITTNEHPIWARKRVFPHARQYKNAFSSPSWTNAGELRKGDMIGFRCNEGNNEYKNEAFWYMVGRYLGDGWILDGKRTSKIPKGKRGSRVTSVNHKVVICCAKKEKDTLHDIIKNAGHRATVSEDKTTFKFIISSLELEQFLSHFGKYSYGKKLPGICFGLTNKLKEALFKGWLSADGYIDNQIMRVTTVSEMLVRGMASIARDVYKTPVSVTKKEVSRVCIIEGRIVNERPQFCLSVSKKSKVGFYQDGFVWTIIKKIEDSINKTVYNIGVYEDESYTAAGIAVHNCQPFSVAGKQLGTEDERHLWPEMLRAIREIQPRWVVGENVRGLINWNGGMVFEQVYADLEDQGYEVLPFLLPSCGVNAPHRRDRIWFIAHHTDAGIESMQQGRDDGIYGFEVAADASIQRREDRQQNGGRQNETKDRTGVEREFERSGSVWITTHPNRKRQSGKKHGENESGFFAETSFSDYWQNFPTQSPIRSGNDGFPSGLVGITVSKHRNESIKAYGNAIVPEVALQIFKAINQYQNTIL